MKICTDLVKRKETLEKYKAEILKNAAFEPEGRIKVSHSSKDSLRFYYVSSKAPTSIEYISLHDKRRISSLLQKRYNNKVLSIIEKQLKAIDSFLKTYNDEDIANQYDSIGKYYKDYIQPFESSYESIISKWKSKPYKGNPYPIEGSYYTTNNERVRSKSELIIANSLSELKIVYKYECPIHLSTGETLYPDFTMIDPNTKEEIYWEHFGRMDSEDYRTKFFEKLDIYSQIGIFPGTNLIMTFEDYKNPLNFRLVKRYISHYFDKK